MFPLLLDFITNIDKFVAAVEEDAAFKPFGEKLAQYKREEEVYEVYKVNTNLDLTPQAKIAPHHLLKLPLTKITFEKCFIPLKTTLT